MIDTAVDNKDWVSIFDENKKFILSFGDTPGKTKEEKIEQIKNMNHISDLVDLGFLENMDYGSTPEECYDNVCETVADLYDVEYESEYSFEEVKKYYMYKVGNTYFVI